MSGVGQAISAALAAIIGLAIVAVVVSKNSQSSNVITAAGSALSTLLTTAINGATSGGANPLNAAASPVNFSAANIGNLATIGNQDFAGQVTG
jgi:membrane DNA delivery protein